MATAIVIMAVLLWAGLVGMFAPGDNILRDWRFSLDNRAPTGNVVLVEIDPQSLEHFGVWPWPRSLHAKAIDALVDYGAYNIALDIDFSSRSTPQNDAVMAKALEDAGGFVILASFAQQSGTDGRMTFNRPIEEFFKNSWAASVNVGVDPDGRVRRFPYSSRIDGEQVPSFPVALSEVEGGSNASFFIDYSIDAFAIDRVSFLDVINGTVAPERIANKNVIIGAGAVELRDNFAVSRYGVISGPLLQVLATETLLQGRQLSRVGYWPGVLIILVMFLFYILSVGRMSFLFLSAAVLSSIIGLEVFGFVLQAKFGLLFNTAGLHAVQFTLVFMSLAFELDRRLGLFKHASQEKAVTQSILNQVITDNFDGVVIVDQNYKIRMASGLAESMLSSIAQGCLVGCWAKNALPHDLWLAISSSLNGGVASEIPREISLVLPGEKKVCLEFVVTRSTIQSSPDEDGGNQKFFGSQHIACLTFRDVTAQRKTAQHIKFIAHHDSVTGALWRVKLAEEITNILEKEGGYEKGISVGALDLRRFKQVNETLGHAVGDQLLAQVVERMKKMDIAHVGRLGGHSFIFCTAIALDPQEIEKFCSELVENLCAPYLLGEHRVIIGVSIGVTDSFNSGPLPDILLAHADMALSNAGSGSRKSYSVYSNELEEELLRKQDVEQGLRTAIDNDELWVAYQPQVSLKTGKLIGVEALIRWEHPKWGQVGPDQFIPVAEETGLIVEIGQWVLRQACIDATNWPVPIHLAVNVSALQFEFSDVCEDVGVALRGAGLAPDRLDIEITESSFVEQSQDIINTLNDLRAKGIGIALDDFGTGYSSLSYLSRLPIDKIKVDQSFVRKLPEDTETGAIVLSILALGEALNKKIVAEGIENKVQAEFLRSGGADIGQGWLFGRPMSDADLRGYMLKQFWCDEDGPEKIAEAG